MSRSTLSAAEARRLALDAQGLSRARPLGRVDRRHATAVFGEVGVIQIDSVNVLCRSQELPLFARLGAHPRDLINRMTQSNTIFEYWGHEASHLPVDLHPVFRWRMEDARTGVGTWRMVGAAARDDPTLVRRIHDQVALDGPITTRDLIDGGPRSDGMWGWSPGKRALEYLFWSGQITARRGPNFERIYDLPERMLPATVIEAPTPSRVDSQKSLIMIAARAMGVATAADLADYFRLHGPTTRRLVADLVSEGRLGTVHVDGWRDPAFVTGEPRVPRRLPVRALLSPFDSLIWNRDRTERLFGMRYRIEIYVPRSKRVHGYYVLPFLLGDRLVARVDLKADRQAGVLRVQSAHGEPDIDVDHVSDELATELGELAAFLGLGSVTVEHHGDLARHLVPFLV
jgi:uncharacterized protein YcaQ